MIIFNGHVNDFQARSGVSLKSAHTWRELILIDLLAMFYAVVFVGILILVSGDVTDLTNSFLHPSVFDSLLIFAVIATGLSSMYFWYSTILRTGNYSLQQGLKSGLLSILFAHPLMFEFWALFIALSRIHEFKVENLLTLLGVVVSAPFLVIFEIFYGWQIWVPTLVFGALGGLLACWVVQRTQRKHRA